MSLSIIIGEYIILLARLPGFGFLLVGWRGAPFPGGRVEALGVQRWWVWGPLVLGSWA